MSQPVTAILYAPGTNCHEETAAAIELAGGKSELVLLRDLLDGRTSLSKYQAAVIPGGFSYGDHLGAGRIFATLLVARLREELDNFLAARRPVLGRSEEHTSELQSLAYLVCRLLLEKKKKLTVM